MCRLPLKPVVTATIQMEELLKIAGPHTAHCKEIIEILGGRHGCWSPLLHSTPTIRCRKDEPDEVRFSKSPQPLQLPSPPPTH